jgi:hypothetical protein
VGCSHKAESAQRQRAFFVDLLYEKDPVGGFDNGERFNRHKLAHGISPQAVTAQRARFG